MHPFEEHARRAASDATESVGRLAVPELPNRPSSAARLVLATAATVVLALASFAVLRGNDSDTSEVSTDEPGPTETDDQAANPSDDPAAQPIDGPTTRLAFSPDASEQVLAGERPPGADGTPEFTVTVYGAGTDEDPIADGFVIAGLLPDNGGRGPVDEGDGFEVRGVMATVVEDDFSAGILAIEWFEPNGVNVQLGSNALDLDGLVTLANTLEIDGAAITLPTPPEPMTTVLENVSSLELPLPGAGWFVSVLTAESTGSSLSGIAAVPNGMVFSRAVLGLHVPVEVRGTVGWTNPELDFPFLVWEEAGMVLTLGDDTGADLVELAEQLVPVSEEEWAELVASAPSPEEFSTGDEPLGRDTFVEVREPIAEGVALLEGEPARWTHYVSVNGDRCFELGEMDDTLLGQCEGDASEPATARFRVLPWDPHSIDGMVADEVKSLTLTTDRREVDVTLTPLSTGGQAFLVFREDDERFLELRGADQTGEVLWQVAIPAEPHWTGDAAGTSVRGPIDVVLGTSYEVIGDVLTEQRLFVTEAGDVCHEYVRGGVESPCSDTDSPASIGGTRGGDLDVAAIRIDDIVSLSGRVSGPATTVEVVTDRRTFDVLLLPLADGSAFATILGPGERLDSVSALTPGREVRAFTRWGTDGSVSTTQTSDADG